MLAAKVVYVTIHALFFVGRYLLVYLVGMLMAGSMGYEGSTPPRAPETGPVSADDFVARFLVTVMLVPIILPLFRRRFDLISMTGSFIIIGLLWVRVGIQGKLVHGDPDSAQYFATMYTACIGVPFTIVSVYSHILRRREVQAATKAARGPCPGCGSDRSTVDMLASCPECGAASVAVKMLNDQSVARQSLAGPEIHNDLEPQSD